MNTMTEHATLFRLWYNRWAPVIMGLCLVIGAGAAVIGVAGIYRTSATQQEQQRLLACFDRYAATSSTSSQVIRVASVRKDEATADRDDALNIEGQAFLQLTKRILAGDVTAADVKRLADALDDRARASRELDRAQDALDKARRENPIPDPPSKFCNEKESDR